MINYRNTIEGVQGMLQDGRVLSLVQLVQNFQQGLAMIQFAVAEIEIKTGFLPATTLETLLLLRQEIIDEGAKHKRMLRVDELNAVWYVDRVEKRSYEERTPLEIAVLAVLESTVAA